MTRKRRIGATTPANRARAGVIRGVDPADRIVRWIGASGRKRARSDQATMATEAPPACEVITLTWAQTFGRPDKIRPAVPSAWSTKELAYAATVPPALREREKPAC